MDTREKELEVSWEPIEIPKESKFLYKINFKPTIEDIADNRIVDKILVTRTKAIDESVLKHLKSIGEEYNLSELIVIDESKLVKTYTALQIIKKHIGVIKGFIYTTDSQITDSEYKLLCEVLRCDS